MGVDVDPKTGNPLGNVPKVLQFQSNFIPAQTTTSINYAANLPSTPTTAVSSTAAAGTINALGGLNPYDFAVNPMPTTTPATPFGDNTVTGTPVLNQQTPTAQSITAATVLGGAAGTDSLNFQAGDTIVVGRLDDYQHTLRARRAAPPRPTSPSATPWEPCWRKIGTITGVTPTITGGAITLHTGTTATLTITSTGTSFPATRLSARR